MKRTARKLFCLLVALVMMFSVAAVMTPGVSANVNITITFDGNGGQPATQDRTFQGNFSWITIGTNGFPDNPTRENYTFDGWFDIPAATGGSRIFGTTMFHNNTTIYARWRPAQRTVTFNANGGTPTLRTQTTNHGMPVSLPFAPSRNCFAFAGWFTTPAATGGAQFTAASIVNADITVWARWTVSHRWEIWATERRAEVGVAGLERRRCHGCTATETRVVPARPVPTPNTPFRPTAGVSNAAGNRAWVRWTAITHAASYRIYRRRAGGRWSFAGSTRGTRLNNIAITRSATGRDYDFRVVAVNSAGVRSSASEHVRIGTLGTARPNLRRVTATNARIRVNYTQVARSNRIELRYRTVGVPTWVSHTWERPAVTRNRNRNAAPIRFFRHQRGLRVQFQIRSTRVNADGRAVHSRWSATRTARLR